MAPALHHLTDTVTFTNLTVCLPAGISGGDPFAVAAHLAGHLPHAHRSIDTRFLTHRSLRTRGLISPVKGHPRRCAGGPLHKLDLDAMRRAAMHNAAVWYAVFQRIVAGTKPATPWPEYVRRHHDKPGKFPLPTARRVFLNQPRVAALVAHNALPGNPQLHLIDLEAFQASYQTYLNIQALRVVAGHALLTLTGELLKPAGLRLADELDFLERANHAIQVMAPQQVIVAVTI